jgi:tetratricopeptide (TPR) repeat protein
MRCREVLAMRMQGEMEFEFREDADGDGRFVACGKVVNVLIAHIARDEIDRAASLFASCAENVGDELMGEIARGGTSKHTLSRLAEMFGRAKDYRRAALCAERAGEPATAARFLEADYELGKAAEYYLAADDLPRAAALFERDLAFDRAAEIFLDIKDFPRAAENLERAGRLFESGRVYVKMKRWDRAMDVLQKVPPDAADFPASALLLGRILEKTGNVQAAARSYVAVVRSRPLDATTVDVHTRLAALCIRENHVPQAKKLVAGVLEHDPDNEEARRLAERLSDSPRPTAVTLSPTAEMMSGGAGEPPPLDLGEHTGEEAGRERVVGVDGDFEFLRRVPLFAELSLEELKYVQSMCERVRFAPGERLITQGEPGEALFVIARGRAAITRTRPDGTEAELGELGPGSHVGDMSLVDDAPTSANVVAREDVNAYRLLHARLRDLMEANERIQLRVYRVFIHSLLDRMRRTNARLDRMAAGSAPAACPSCDEPAEPGARHCPHCGAALR